MGLSNRERVGRGLEQMSAGMLPFLERELKAAHGDDGWDRAAKDRQKGPPKPLNWADSQVTLNLLLDEWNGVFRNSLANADRSMAFEVRDARNRWAHGEKFGLEDAHRALDSMARLSRAVGSEAADELNTMAMDLLREQFDRQSRRDVKKATTAGTPVENLPAWRDVVQPHPDVASGRYQDAEFMADLWQVHLGQANPEYGDAREFFRRTYLTDGLSRLLTGAARRLSGEGGDPVVELQTNFGGGKSHSMLALYHLCDHRAADLPGVDTLFQEEGVSAPKDVRKAVLHGVRLSPGQPSKKEDGTVVRTLWGELAHQLGGAEGYALVAEADRTGTSPGDALRTLFDRFGPALILIDEWVRYAAQLHEGSDLPAGSFDAQFSFAQALTEAARASRNALLVVSIPASEGIETGGEWGTRALERLRNAVGRVEAPWRPASAEEGFEIVRRRLFEPLDADAARKRDTVAKAFRDEYARQHREFPSGCKEPAYEDRLKAAYPIHPELFDRLYEDWGSLEKFQRTRGVLRLMAGVIHALWEAGDRNLLILPGTIPAADARVTTELNRYLPENYAAVLEKDVDGSGSLPATIDGEVPTLGRYHATRRVARTVFVGSAPIKEGANRGIDEARVKLGCVQPGESVATFGDALRRLTGRATYLYGDAGRYWYSTQPTVNKLAEERAADVPDDLVEQELTTRLRGEEKRDRRAAFAGVHVTADPADVPDEPEVRLVILPPDHPHTLKADDSPALTAAREVLTGRGKAARQNRNAVVFAAADVRRLEPLRESVRRFLAWRSVCDDQEVLELTRQSARQAEGQREKADAEIDGRLAEAYVVVLSPTQPDPAAEVEWDEANVPRAGRDDGLAKAVEKRLVRDEGLITEFAGVTLRHHLDRVPLWRAGADDRHVAVAQLLEDFARYLYLPRLRSPELLTEAAVGGVSSLMWEEETFAYAEGFDEAKGRYLGLCGGRQDVRVAASGLLVKPEVAAAQFDRERPKPVPAGAPEETGVGPSAPSAPQSATAEPAAAARNTRFFGTVLLDPQKLGIAAGTIQKEVVQHLAGLADGTVTVRLDIEARLPEGADEKLERDVRENCRTLKFETAEFSGE